MEIRQLEYFQKASEHRNLSAAARELFISEQALSKSIVALEKELGFSLFVRDRKGVALTQAGDIMLSRASGIISDLDDLRQVAADIRDSHDTQPLRIGFYEGFLGDEKAPFPTRELASFQNSHPEILLKIREETNERIRTMVCDKELDMGVFVGEVPATCCSITLQQMQLHVVAGLDNPLSHRRRITWEDMKDQVIIFPRGERRMRDMMESFYRQRGFELQALPVDISFDTSLTYVYANDAVMLVDIYQRANVDRKQASVLDFSPDDNIMRPLISIAWTNDQGITSNHYKVTDLFRRHFNRTRAFV